MSDPGIGEFSKWVGKRFTIHLKADQKWVIDTRGRQNGGGPIALWNYTDEINIHQRFTVTSSGELQSVDNTGSILYVANGNNGTEIRWVNRKDKGADTLQARWHLTSGGLIKSRKWPDKAIDLNGGQKWNDSKLHLWTADPNNKNQQWVIKQASIGKFSSWVNKSFIIRNKHNRNLVIGASNIANNAAIVLQTYSGSDNQVWTVQDTGRVCLSSNNGYALHASGDDNRANVVLSNIAAASVNANSCWEYRSDERLRMMGTNGDVYRYIDVRNGNISNGNPLQIFQGDANKDQQWVIEKTDNSIVKRTSNISKLSIADFKRAWDAPFIMKINISGYNSCLSVPYEPFTGCYQPRRKSHPAVAVLLIVMIIGLSIALYILHRSRRYYEYDYYIDDDNGYQEMDEEKI